MNEIAKINLPELTKFWLSEIIGIENQNFQQEINQRKLCSKKLSKYVTTFDYVDKILIVLSTTSSGGTKVWVDERKCEECQWKTKKYEIQ